MAVVAGAVVAAGVHQLDPMVVADFEAGLDGLATNDLIDEAEVDSIVRETTLHTIGDLPWADAKVGAGGGRALCGQLGRLPRYGAAPTNSRNNTAVTISCRRWAPGRLTSSKVS